MITRQMPPIKKRKKVLKIDAIYKKWTPNTLVTTKWLSEQGLSREGQRLYIDKGLLIKIGTGVLARPGDRINWIGALHTIQNLIGLPIHIGGRTALELAGILPPTNDVYLYGEKGRLPSWFRRLDWGVNIHLINASTMPKEYGIFKHLFTSLYLDVSSPERAMIELLLLVPSDLGLEEAYAIIGKVKHAKIYRLQNLLEELDNIKINRMLLFCADYNKLEWYPKLNRNKLNKGTSGRMLTPGGRYNGKHKLTVPLSIWPGILPRSKPKKSKTSK